MAAIATQQTTLSNRIVFRWLRCRCHQTREIVAFQTFYHQEPVDTKAARNTSFIRQQSITKTSKCGSGTTNNISFAISQKAKRLETAKYEARWSAFWGKCFGSLVSNLLPYSKEMSYQMQGMAKRKLLCTVMKHTGTGLL